MLFKKKKSVLILAPISGKLIKIEEVNDPVFAGKMIGDGFAIVPEEVKEATFFSPVSGILKTVMDTGHAYGINEETTGVECLVHIGIDTVELNGEGFTIIGKQDSKIKEQDPLVKVDFTKLKAAEKETTTPILFTNDTLNNLNYQVNILKYGQVKQGEAVAELVKK